MAKKNIKSVTVEQQAEDSEAAKVMEQQSAVGQLREQQPEDSEAAKTAVFHGGSKKYKIICRNKITKRIGGVDFTNGEGYTSDGYAASWFAAKDGYTVEPAE